MKVLLGKYGIYVGIGLLVVGLVIGFVLNYGFRNIFGTDSESRNTQVVESLEREEQIVLLSLGIQGIAEERQSRTVFGAEVPGTGKTLFLQYTYRVKLGLEGEQVRIEAHNEDTIRIHVPEFAFIGHDNIAFQTALEDNGMLSWVTPDIDTPDLVTDLLTEQHIAEHIETNRDLLEMQTTAFYEGIIHSVDPELKVEFEFTNSTIGR